MKTLSRRTLAGLAIVGLASAYGAQANASCSYTPGEAVSLGVLDPAAAGGLAPESARSFSTIVGLWRVVFTAKNSPPVPDGAVVDDAIVTWHADGTEIMNSGKPPITSSFCMGTWVRKGDAYKLKHVALSWDPTGTQFVGQAIIRENVHLNSSGRGYWGTFTIDQLAADGKTVLAHVAGTVKGSRITAD